MTDDETQHSSPPNKIFNDLYTLGELSFARRKARGLADKYWGGLTNEQDAVIDAACMKDLQQFIYLMEA